MIEMGKKYQTRDGRAVRILATDMRSNHPIAGIVTDVEGTEFVCSWTPEGYVEWGTTKANTDLIPVPTKHEGWMPVRYYVSDRYWINGRIYDSEQEAISSGHDCIIAHVTWED